MRYLFLVFLCTLFVGASELKKSKLDELLLKRNKGVLESDINKNSWLSPLILETKIYKINNGDSDADTVKSIEAVWSQDIYRGGGIGYERELANLEKNIKTKSIDIELQQLNISIYEYVLILKMTDLKLSQLDLYIKNKNIEIATKKDRYKQGVLDISELDIAMLELETLKNQKNDIQKEKFSFMEQLKILSNKSYKNIKVLKFTFPSMERYMSKNSIHILKDKSKYAQVNKDLQASRYLPKVSLVSSYKYEDSKFARDIRIDKSSLSFGVSASMLFGFNENREKELAHVDYMISQTKYQNSIDDEKIFYQNIVQKIKLIKQRIANHRSAIKNYSSLIKDTKDMFENGLKNKDDLRILGNTKKAKSKEIMIDKLNIKILTLQLYKRM